MTGSDLRFDSRNLPAALRDSCRLLAPFARHLLERPSVAIEPGLLAAQPLPPLHNHVDVLRIQLHAAADALGQFRGGERCARPQKRLFCGVDGYVG